MFTSTAMTDLHERVHQSLVKLLDHCEGFSEDELSRAFDGFGAGSIRDQLQHVIGAEQYWVGVLYGMMLTDDDDADAVSIDALRGFRERVVDVTNTYIRTASDGELNTRRRMLTWGDREVDIVPAHVLLRIQTHAFHHQGQIAAMARLLGRPIPAGLDFPLG